MKGVFYYITVGFVLMLLQSGVASAFGVESVCAFGVLVGVLLAVLGMPRIPSILGALVLAVLCDFYASGVPGAYALCQMVVFQAVYCLMNRVRPQRTVSIAIFAAVACIGFDALCAVFYSVYYASAVYWRIFLRIFWKDALWTAAWTPILMWGFMGIGRMISARRKSGLT